jgi:N-acetylmuramoyl-L-alanine amidase
MKFAIDLGHGCPPDTGAKGLRQEEDLINEVGKLLIAKLKTLHHEIVEVRPKKAGLVRESLDARVLTANTAKVDIYISLHFNASDGRGHGTEVFAIGEKGQKIAESVVEEISKLGYSNRGVKPGNHLYVVRCTNMPAILIEGCFLDSINDMRIYDAEKMSQAIVLGLIKGLPT